MRSFTHTRSVNKFPNFHLHLTKGMSKTIYLQAQHNSRPEGDTHNKYNSFGSLSLWHNEYNPLRALVFGIMSTIPREGLSVWHNEYNPSRALKCLA
jgi:hypothetical protein